MADLWATKRYGRVVPNYITTSDHVHLLIYDRGGGELIPKSVRLAAGRTAQEYNQRKREKRWSESIAVGDLSFVEQVKIYLRARGFGRQIISSAEGHELRQPQLSYQDHFDSEMRPLSYENSLLSHAHDVSAL